MSPYVIASCYKSIRSLVLGNTCHMNATERHPIRTGRDAVLGREELGPLVPREPHRRHPSLPAAGRGVLKLQVLESAFPGYSTLKKE